MDVETGAPKDELAPDTLTWFKTLGVEYKKLSEVLAAGPCPKVCISSLSLIFIIKFELCPLLICLRLNQVFAGINEGISRANKHATSNAQKIQKFAILPADFSIPTGELGPTLKIKRNIVSKKYEDVINQFYE